MSYLYKFESFKKNRNTNSINEEILGTLFNWAKNFYKKAKEKARRVKGGEALKDIYDKYLKDINDQLENRAKISLNLKGEEQLVASKATAPKSAVTTAESLLIREAEDQAPLDQAPLDDEEETEEDKKNKRLDADTLKQKLNIIKQIMDIKKKAARKEMEKVLAKYGGAEKNPDLKVLIDTKIREFDLALLSSEMEYLDKAGDKNAVQKVKLNRDKVQKEIEMKYNKIGTKEARAIKVGNKTLYSGSKYRYKTPDGVKTIVVKNESDEDGKVEAAYVAGDTADQVQKFRIQNIDTEFVPEKDKEYSYYSQNNKKVITVTVTGEPDQEGMVTVKTAKGEFEVEKGSLFDKEEQEQR